MDLFTLMHDTAGPTATIKSAVTLLKGGKLSAEDTIKMLDAITERADRINAVLDQFYVEAKENETKQP
jgi:nitrogen-specific signal transduction histidine kinase